MSTITYLIVGDYDNYYIGSGGGYVHNELYHQKDYAIDKAVKAVKDNELVDTKVLEMNTSNGSITTVWEQDT